MRYTLVTATGAILSVTPTSYPDLYRALRGGGNNFGLVVRFDMDIYPLPRSELWGGARAYAEPDFPAVLDAWTHVVSHAEEDKVAGQWLAFLENQGLKLVSAEFWHGEANADAPIFAGYDGLQPVTDSTKLRSVKEYAAELQKANPDGLREVYWCTTIKADREMAEIATNVFYEELPAVEKVAGVMPVLLLQGITVPMMEAMKKNGGNALGLDPDDGARMLVHIPCWWTNEVDDERVYGFVSRVLARVNEEAKKRGLSDRYRYMNYASMFQNVIAGYGEDNKRMLKDVARKYDPTGVFQRLQPGYFKLEGAPVADQ